MSGEEQNTYDPLISGLEPEPFNLVFQEIFAGVKNYLALEESAPSPAVSESLSGYRPDENTPQPSSVPDVPQLVEPERSEQISETRTRQYPMLRCAACFNTFVSEFALEHHEAQMHPELFGWCCVECDVHFDDLRYASDHALMTHGDGEMPVHDTSYQQFRKQGMAMFMQMITRRSSDFVKDFLFSRDKRMIMTTSYFTYSKCELQAVYTGNVALVSFNQAKNDLLSNYTSSDYKDLVECLKNSFIYGNVIKRIPLITHRPPATVYRTLTFSNIPIAKGVKPMRQATAVFKKKVRPAKPGTTLRDVVAKMPQRHSPPPQSYVMRPQVRVAPYPQQQVRTVVRLPINGRYRSQVVPVRQAEAPVFYAPIEVHQ